MAACARRMNNDMYRESTEPEQTNVNRTIASLVTRSVQETVQVDVKWQNREQKKKKKKKKKKTNLSLRYHEAKKKKKKRGQWAIFKTKRSLGTSQIISVSRVITGCFFILPTCLFKIAINRLYS